MMNLVKNEKAKVITIAPHVNISGIISCHSETLYLMIPPPPVNAFVFPAVKVQDMIIIAFEVMKPSLVFAETET